MATYAYRAYEPSVSFNVANKDMLNLFNASPTIVVSVYRVEIKNSNTFNAGSSALISLQLNRITSATGPNIQALNLSAGTSSKTLTALDNNYPPCDPLITKGVGQTVVSSATFRHLTWSSGVPFMSASSNIDNWETQVPYTTVWEAGMIDDVVEPIVSRLGFGLDIFSLASASNNGTIDCMIEANIG